MSRLLLPGGFLLGASGGLFFAVITGWQNIERDAHFAATCIECEDLIGSGASALGRLFIVCVVAPACAVICGLISLAIFALLRRTRLSQILRFFAAAGFATFFIALLLLLQLNNA